MAYSELIKNLDTLRTYVRSFYIYGFKTRDRFFGKSPRTYDDEKRRLENYLNGYMAFRPDENGKVTFLSIDSRHTIHNPLYKIFKTKSFTAMDISLHFMLMDILADGSKKTLNQLLDEINDVYLKDFSQEMLPEESGLRKKLKEYEELGLISLEKDGKTMLYFRNSMTDLNGLEDALSFFSEISPCGVTGSFLYDKLPKNAQKESEVFQFKHHYITSSIESDFVEQVFEAIREHRYLTIEQRRAEEDRTFPNEVVPLMIYQSAQGGRMYLMGYRPNGKYFLALRFDYIIGITTGEVYSGFEQKRAEFEELRKHIWGVALKQNKRHNDTTTAHVTFRVHFEEDEKFIYQRLLREKRCGTITLLDDNNAQFDADVFDPQEIIPWARSFICRITFFDCSEKIIARRFYGDIRKMNRMYCGEEENSGEADDAV
ncbi:MAG: WYL domain-containing protein [Treponema sp.]|nr:WYL domain-containing protein [Treponema sp.]